MEKIYFDYAASTPVDQRVLRAMEPYFTEKFGNPGSLHSFGQEAITAVDKSRETIAKALGANFREVIFTGSATEANNLALRGALKAFSFKLLAFSRDKRQRNLTANSYKLKPRIIVSAIEHESVLETARDLEREGVEVVYLPVDRRGIVDLGAFKKALNDRTVLVSVMYANNEIGTIQPISEISNIIRDFRNGSPKSQFPISNKIPKSNGQSSKNWILGIGDWDLRAALPLLHTDAAQAFQFLNCDVKKLGIDLMTFSAHKIYGPKGIGALYVRNLKPNTYNLKPILTGGGQEFGLRSGTENVPAIVGFAKATELLFSNSRELENKRIAGLRDYFWHQLAKIYPKAEVNGQPPSTNYESGTNIRIRKFVKNSLFVDKLPNILNVYFPGHEAQFLLTKLDLAGVAASSGSACRSRAFQSSYVIEALGYSKERARRSIRFSFGRPTTKEEIQKALITIGRCLRD